MSAVVERSLAKRQVADIVAAVLMGNGRKRDEDNKKRGLRENI
jgi:hypothetical protein